MLFFEARSAEKICGRNSFCYFCVRIGYNVGWTQLPILTYLLVTFISDSLYSLQFLLSSCMHVFYMTLYRILQPPGEYYKGGEEQ